jgi:hypothetical protein
MSPNPHRLPGRASSVVANWSWPGVGHGDDNVTRFPQARRSASTPGGTRTRSFRVESPASFPFDHGGSSIGVGLPDSSAADAGSAGVGH